MSQESRLVIVIDSKNAERNTAALNDELAKIFNSGNKAANSTDNLGASIKTTSGAAKDLTGSVGATTKALSDQERALAQNAVALKSLATFVGGFITISSAIARADGYTQMAARIEGATASAAEYDMVQKRLLETANTTYRSLSEAQEAYLGIEASIKLMGKTTEQALNISDAMSFAFTANATSADKAQSAMNAYAKSLDIGKVGADQWISIMQGIPGIAADIAKSTGKTEQEIRSLGVAGKVSVTDMSDAFEGARTKYEDAANAMSNSLADGYTRLSNAIDAYIGEANRGYGATDTMAAALGVLAENISTVADVAMLGGVAFLTKTIAAKTVVVYDDIKAAAVHHATQVAARQEAVKVAAAKVAEAKAHLANVQATNAETQAKYGATAANARYKLATDAVTASVAAQTAAQGALSKMAALGSRALGLVGGPLGALTIGVTAVAAAYGYMQKRTAEATEKLAEQAKVAEKTSEELKNLSGTKRQKAIDDLTESFESQNKALHKSYLSMGSALVAVENLYGALSEEARVAREARQGIISYDEAIKQFNELKINTGLYDHLVKTRDKYDENSVAAKKNADAQNLLGREVALAGNKFQNSVAGVNASTKSMNENEVAAKKAKEAQAALSEQTKSLQDKQWDTNFKISLVSKHGYTPDEAEKMLETYRENQKKGYEGVSNAQERVIKSGTAQEKIYQGLVDKQKEQTKELEKQQKILKASATVQANAAKYNFGGFESKYGLPSGMLTALHAIETGNTGKTAQVNKQTGATGGFQFLKGTADQYGVKDRTNMTQSAEGAAKYMSYLLKLFKGDLEKSVRAYHAGEGNVQRGKNIGKFNNDYWQKFKGYTAGVNGYASGDISSKDFEKSIADAAKLLEEQAKNRIQLETAVADQVGKIRAKLAEDFKEIDKAGFSDKDATALKAKYQAQADNEIAIAQYALKTKLDDYKDFRRSEEELLEKSFEDKKFAAMRDLELNADERKKAVALLEEQYQIEKGYLALAKEHRLFQMREQFMTETQAMQERYYFEEIELVRINDVQERNFQRQMIRLKKEEESRKRLNDAAIAWDQAQAQMRGSTGQMQIDQDRFGRMDASQQLFDAQMSSVDSGEQAALSRIQDQMNQDLITQQQFEDQKTMILETALQTRQAIYDEHVNRQSEVERDYLSSSLKLNLSKGEQIAGSLADSMRTMEGEQSKSFKVMFATNKAFAVAQSMIAIQQGIANAMSLPFPANLGAAATVAAETASILSNINSVHLAFGGRAKELATGGLVRGAGTGTSDSIPAWLSNEEFVIKAKAVKSIGVDNLNRMNQTGELPQIQREARQAREIGRNSSNSSTVIQPQIIINTPPGMTARTEQRDGKTYVTIEDVRRELGDQIGRPNSELNKGLKQQYEMKLRR